MSNECDCNESPATREVKRITQLEKTNGYMSRPESLVERQARLKDEADQAKANAIATYVMMGALFLGAIFYVQWIFR